MKIKRFVQTAFFLLILYNPLNLDSCTSFCFKDKNGNIFFGKNFDFSAGSGTVQINQRGVGKISFPIDAEKPLKWESKYGSITFNQNGREFPYGGINEAGLVIEQMMLPGSRYPKEDDRYPLEELQWIQYQLDVAGTVDEVIKNNSIVRINEESQAPLHFSVADAMGNFAVIEFLNGQTVVHTGRDAVYHVLANDPYDVSIQHKDQNYTASRFVRAANMIELYNKSNEEGVQYAFKILDNVSQGTSTKWSIVYDIKRKVVYYKTITNTSIRKIQMKDFDFAFSENRIFADIDSDCKAPSGFQLFDCRSNFELINKVWNSVDFLKGIPEDYKKLWAYYPDMIKK